MTLVSGLVTTYLTPPYVLPQGVRQQFAGALYSASDFYARGGTGTPPINKRINKILYASERDSNPQQANLTADYLALTGP